MSFPYRAKASNESDSLNFPLRTDIEEKEKRPGFIGKLKERFANRPLREALNLIKVDLFNGMEDAVRDNIDESHPKYKWALEKAKMYDKVTSFIPPIFGFPGSYIANDMLEEEVRKNGGAKLGINTLLKEQ